MSNTNLVNIYHFIQLHFFYITKCDVSVLSLVKIAFAIQGLLWYHMKFKIIFNDYCEKYPCNFDIYYIESGYCFG